MQATNDPHSDVQPARGVDVKPVVGRRVAAAVIDLVPLVLVAVALSHRVDSARGAEYRLEGASLAATVVISLLYWFVPEALTGTSVGKWAMGLTVVDEDGGKPGVGKVLVRTGMRVVDGFPLLYLVGFVCMLASPSKRRVGDMVAHTDVVRRSAARAAASSSGRPVSGRWPAALALLGVCALGGSVAAVLVEANDGGGSPHVGRFELDHDVLPFVDAVVADLGAFDAEGLRNRFVPGVITDDEADALMSQVHEVYGTASAEPTFLDHAEVVLDDVPGFDRLDVMEILLDVRFTGGVVPVRVAVADADGELRLLRIDIAAPPTSGDGS